MQPLFSQLTVTVYKHTHTHPQELKELDPSYVPGGTAWAGEVRWPLGCCQLPEMRGGRARRAGEGPHEATAPGERAVSLGNAGLGFLLVHVSIFPCKSRQHMREKWEGNT